MVDNSALDIIGEVVNIGTGEAADALSRLVGSPVKLRVPEVRVMPADEVPDFMTREIGNLGVYIAQDFRGEVSGRALLAYTEDCSAALIECITGAPKVPGALTESERATLQEIGNIIMVSCVSTFSNMLEGRIDFEIPQVTQEVSDTYFRNMVRGLAEMDQAILVKSQMVVRELEITGMLFLLFSFTDFQTLLDSLRSRHDK